MTILIEMVKRAIKNAGGDGLYNEYGCGCGLDDLAPCGDGPYQECMMARKFTVPAHGDLIDPDTGQRISIPEESRPGDTIYVPLK